MNKQNPPYFLVIGLGRSGTSMAEFLASKGKNVIATDIDESKVQIAKKLNKLGIKTQIGFHDQKTFNLAKIMVPSPGISLHNKYIQSALNKGVKITGELDIFTKYNDLPVIAITGTNGKTTVTSLTGEMLKKSHITPFVCGNIGTPMIKHLMTKSNKNKKTDIIVAEISSFQLDLAKNFRPDIGVLLNISQDHLDRYENFDRYIDSKWSIFQNQRTSDIAVINNSIHGFNSKYKKIKSKIIRFSSNTKDFKNCDGQINSKEIKINHHMAKLPNCNTIQYDKIIDKDKIDKYKIDTSTIKELKGIHNQENIAAACLASLAAGANFNNILKSIKCFKNLSHRMEFVKTINGISFYNDSKATNIDAVIRALEYFQKNIILILGGREKQNDFSLLTNQIKNRVKTIIAIGETRLKIKDIFEKICPVKIAKTMKNAVQTAFDTALKNDVILLSPACASFDMYENYELRGDDFINCVEKLPCGTS